MVRHQNLNKLLECCWLCYSFCTLFLESAFPGLYIVSLRSRCWSSDGRRVVMQTFWRSKCELVVIDTDTGNVTRLTDGTSQLCTLMYCVQFLTILFLDPEIGVWSFLDMKNDMMVCSRSSPSTPDHLVRRCTLNL